MHKTEEDENLRKLLEIELEIELDSIGAVMR